MATSKTNTVGPSKIPVGVLVRYTASIPTDAPKGTTATWQLLEPGRKPRNLGSGPSLTYVAPRRLQGKSITVRSQLTLKGSKPFDIQSDIVAFPACTLPTKRVEARLAAGWTKDATHHAASIDGADDFLVGRPQPYTWKDKAGAKHVNVGIALSVGDAQFFYSPADYAGKAPWSEVIACSTLVEGGGAFEALNTYDTASFTFGLIQFGAHTYNDNFHVFLRNAFQSHAAEADYYFGDRLRLHANGLDFEGLNAGGAWVRLTSKDVPGNDRLRSFIKPVDTEVTASEVLFGAKIMHWTRAQPGLRKIMVDMAFARARANFKNVAAALDGKGIAVCAAVFDIRLQGRGSNSQIVAALKTAKPLDSLMGIVKGTKGEAERLQSLRAAIDARFKNSSITYHAKTGELS